MFENLHYAVRKMKTGLMLFMIAGSGLYAQQLEHLDDVQNVSARGNSVGHMILGNTVNYSPSSSLLGNNQPCNNTDPGGNPGDVGCVNFTYQGQQVSYTTVRGGDGKIWLQQNLGSANVAIAVGDEDSFGDLFQWGRWDDGHQLRNSPLTAAPGPNNPSGLSTVQGAFITGSPAWWAGFLATDTWNATNIMDAKDETSVDPCKAIGPDWKMPSQSEWAGIVSAEGISNPATAYSSHLKLPAGGSRGSGNGDFSFVGQRGYFWSSDTSGLGGKYLYIGNTIANASAGAPRGQGASVRCIKPSSSLGISETKPGNSIAGLYPNPTNGTLYIKAGSNIENVQVTNTLGQKVNILFSNDQIDMTALPDGIYLVELTLKNGQSVSKKVIKK
ncbi:T9SS type A sorting domain-containing protein [Chryseobacterium pennipullorum]|nr:T9SS type A sorting domain-containing protein [Chryseobacterium pennipullorum]